MKVLLRLCAITVLVAVVLGSCKSKKTGALSLIPNNASIVVSVNTGQLMDKLAKDGLTLEKLGMAFNTGQLDSAATPAETFWGDSKKTGIDFSRPAYISIHVPSTITSKHAPIRVILSIANKKTFEEFLGKSGAETKKEDGVTYAMLDESVIGYDGKNVIYVSAMNADALTGMKTGASPLDEEENDNEFSADSARKEIARSFALKSSENITSVKDFDEMPLGNNDMRIWTSYETGVSNMMRGDMSTAALLMEKLLKGGSSATTLNFEKGQVTMQSRMYFNKNAADTILLSPSRTIDLSLLDKFPGSRLNALMAVGVDPQLAKDLLKFLNLDGSASFALAVVGLKTDDIFNAITGDIMVVASDFKMPPLNELAKTEGVNDNNMIFKFANVAALVKIKDKALLEKVLNNPKVAEKITREGNNYVFSDKGEKILINIQGPVMIITGSQQLIDQYNAGTARSGFDAAATGRFANKTAGFYLNPRSIYEGLPQDLVNGRAIGMKEHLLMAVKEVYMTSGKFTRNYIQTDGAAVLADNSRNSLSSIVRGAIQMAGLMFGGGHREEMDMDLQDVPNDRLQPMDIAPVDTPAVKK